MDLLRTLQKAADKFIDALFPPKCLVCGEIGSICCKECEGKLPAIDRDGACPVCGSPVIISYGAYEGALRDAIIDFKYSKSPEIGRKLVIFMLSHMDFSFMRRVDICVPVPLHESREAERGYNQSEIVARCLAKAYGKPCSSNNLWRIKKTRTQVGLGRDERAENLRGCFAVKNEKEVSGKLILLVDDVCTTGSTLSECSETLLKAGALEVWSFSVAKTARDKTDG